MKGKESPYMHWAKARSQARFNLTSSGVAPFPLRELEADLTALEINGDNSYGYRPLQEAIAAYSGAAPECIIEAAGTSMANHLAMGAILEPGDEMLLEFPAYGPLVDLANYFRVTLKRVSRREENEWAVDPAEIRRAVSNRTRLIVLTNPHNPTSVLTSDSVLEEVGRIAEEVGAYVLVDEVYLATNYSGEPRSSFHLGPRFVITNSLTKAYGLSGLRCGWILAEPALAGRIRKFNDLFSATPVHPGELLSVAAFKKIPLLSKRASDLVESDRAVLNAFLQSEDRLATVAPSSGTTVFPRLRKGEVDRFIERLRDEFETSVVPGGFFEMPDHFRIGMGVDHSMFAEGLSRIARALG